MSEQKHSKNQTDKICEMSSSNDWESKELDSLVKDPSYFCKNCGRSAASEENLCQPEKL
jgi:hypothetical protein